MNDQIKSIIIYEYDYNKPRKSDYYVGFKSREEAVEFLQNAYKVHSGKDEDLEADNCGFYWFRSCKYEICDDDIPYTGDFYDYLEEAEEEFKNSSSESSSDN